MSHIRLVFILFISLLAQAPAPPADAGPFVGEKYDASVQRQLDIPVFYALPESAFAPLPKELPTADLLIDFKHPASKAAPHPLGFRIYSHKQDGSRASSLAESGFIQTGDVILSFRPEWGGGGPYPNIQMGVSHAGVAVVNNGVLYNIDMPLTPEYMGQLNSPHYQDTKVLHVIRPRGLTDRQKANLVAWAGKLASRAPKIYPRYLAFNQDYTSPNYRPGQPLKFVQQLGRLALGDSDGIALKMYCSEFAWSLLSLRDCDPNQPSAFKKGEVPACIHPIFTPLPMVGSSISTSSAATRSPGLADGPLLTINAMGLPTKERDPLLDSVFRTDPNSNGRMSPGHRSIAEQMQPLFVKFLSVYHGIFTEDPDYLAIRAKFNTDLKDNYSPTSFLIQTLLPGTSPARTMDYVGTITYIGP